MTSIFGPLLIRCTSLTLETLGLIPGELPLIPALSSTCLLCETIGYIDTETNFPSPYKDRTWHIYSMLLLTCIIHSILMRGIALIGIVCKPIGDTAKRDIVRCDNIHMVCIHG